MLSQRLFILGVASIALFCCTLHAKAVIPDSITLQPSSDAHGEFTGGSWSLFDSVAQVLMVRTPTDTDNEYRAAIEFDIGTLPVGAVVNSATLKLMSMDFNALIGIYGYAGDGVVQASDLAVDNWILFFDHNPGLNEVDVTGFVQSLVSSGENYAGFALREEAANHYALFTSVESDFPPELLIEYVPEPATLGLLLLSGLAMLRSQKQANPRRTRR